MTRTLYILISLFVLVFGAGIVTDVSSTKEKILKKYARTVEQKLHNDYQEVLSTLKSSTFFELGFRKENHHENQVEAFRDYYKKPYSLSTYEGGELRTWFNNSLFIDEQLLAELPEGETGRFQDLSNVNAYIVKVDYPDSPIGKKRQGVGIVPIKYAFQNPKLDNWFAASSAIPSTISITNEPSAFSFASPDGQEQLYLNAPDNFRDIPTQKRLLLLYGLALVLFLLIANSIAIILSRKSLMQGAIFLLSVIVMFVLAFNLSNFTDRFNNLGIFTESFSTPVLGSSLGGVVVNTIVFIWLMVFLHREYTIRKYQTLKSPIKFTLAVLANLALMACIVVVLQVFKDMVLESSINLNLLSLLKLELFSFLALTVMVAALGALLLFANRMTLFIKSLSLSQRYRSLATLIAFGIVTGAVYIFEPGFSQPILYGSAILVPFFFDIINNNLHQAHEPYQMFLWLILASFFAATSLHIFQNQKDEREMFSYAVALADERDTLAEKEIVLLVESIIHDSKLDSIYRPHPLKYDFEEASQLVHEHYKKRDYLVNNYSISFSFFDAFQEPAFKDQTLSYATHTSRLSGSKQIPFMDELFQWNDDGGSFLYLAPRVIDLGGTSCTFVLEVEPNLEGFDNVNSPLLSKNQYKDLSNLSDYDYVTFKNQYSIRRKGNVIDYYELPAIPKKGKYESQQNSKYLELVYHDAGNDNIIYIRKKTGGMLRFFSLWSMLFFMVSIFTIFIDYLNKLIPIIPKGINISLLANNSLYEKIQSGFLILLYVSFLIIGIITGIYFNDSNAQYHSKRILRKSNSVMTHIQHEIGKLQNPTIKQMITLVEPLSEIHHMAAVNLYNTSGKLIYSSKKEIYYSGLTAPQMDAETYFLLSEFKLSERVQNEKIGNIHFKSSYFPIKLPDKELIGYLGLPYTKEQARRNDLNEFVTNLLIAYIGLFILALVIIVIASRAITKPIEKLRETIRKNTDAPIIWQQEDEFSEFVEVYNESLEEKKRHHQEKVRMERESAWREMARQVAHDIKNPLTPIKLHIQHFHRSIMSGMMTNDEVETRTHKLTDLILKQVKSLTETVTNFQDIARISEGQTEMVVLNDMLKDVYNLYKSEDNVDLQITLPESSVYVEVQKNQMERVFSNLVKNGIQAIPDDIRGKIDIHLMTSEGQAIVSIKDNGTGIPTEIREKLFTPNFTTKSFGTGLGLHICKNIVETYNGRITYETVLGEGTTFMVELVLNKEVIELEKEMIES